MIYQIYDAKNTCLLEDYPIVEAKRPIEAAQKYLASKNENVSLKRSSDRDVRIGVFSCIFENGKYYRLAYKRQIWFKETNK